MRGPEPAELGRRGRRSAPVGFCGRGSTRPERTVSKEPLQGKRGNYQLAVVDVRHVDEGTSVLRVCAYLKEMED
jgi:hypothetical protein